MILGFVTTFLVCFYYRVELFFLISNPLLSYKDGFIYTGLLDPLLIYFKLSFLVTTIIIFPIFIYSFGFFFFKGMYTFNIKLILLYLISFYIISLSLFFFLSKLLLPFIFDFLISFQRISDGEVLELKLQATITQYYEFFFSYIFIYLLFILIPNLFFILVISHAISIDIFTKHLFRKYLYFCLFLLFILIAPPDFIIQLTIIPFLILFLEIYIFFITFCYNIFVFFD